MTRHVQTETDPLTILIIDDDPTNLAVIVDYLEGRGYQILVARDGESGWARAKYASPDLILLDVMMPGIDGFETCRRLKADEQTQHIPVIFMTALAGTSDMVAGFEAGGVDYVAKPIKMAEVLARVKTHLSLSVMQKQLEVQNVQLQKEITERKQTESKLNEYHEHLEDVVSERTREITQTNRRLKEEIAERQRAEQETRRRNRELTLLNRVIAASVAATDEATLLALACREVALAYGVPQSTAFLINHEKTEFYVAAQYLTNRGPSTKPQHPIPLDSYPATFELINSNTPVVAKNVRQDPRFLRSEAYIQQTGLVSVLTVPVINEGKVSGFLSLETTKARQFSDEEIDLLQSVANQVAGVLARLRLDKDHRKLEEHYYQAQKMEAIGQLTGGVAHDFNNILTIILGNCDFILDDLDADNPWRYSLDQIHKAATGAASLTRQLLAFSRQQVLQPEVLSINSVVANVEKMLKRLIGEDIDLETVLDPELGRVKADPGQLEQVIMNLAVNARDAMPQGGKLTIETANVQLDESYTRQHIGLTTGPYTLLAISDTGIGLDPNTVAHIFEPFFTTKKKGKGTGLGLATVHGIVKQSEGHIWVYSEPGRGTTFKIYLPQVELPETRIERAPAQAKPTRGTETILLVEDDQMVRELGTRILHNYGYTVLKAGDGAEARRLCEEHNGPIDLLLTDVVMPGGVAGPQLAAQLEALIPKIKVLFMSGYTDNAIVRNKILDRGIAFLPKPFMPDDLLRHVRLVLDKAS
jgi:signal transduction histidine kinase/DNA-binding response OmpR family regulator